MPRTSGYHARLHTVEIASLHTVEIDDALESAACNALSFGRELPKDGPNMRHGNDPLDALEGVHVSVAEKKKGGSSKARTKPEDVEQALPLVRDSRLAASGKNKKKRDVNACTKMHGTTRIHAPNTRQTRRPADGFCSPLVVAAVLLTVVSLTYIYGEAGFTYIGALHELAAAIGLAGDVPRLASLPLLHTPPALCLLCALPPPSAAPPRVSLRSPALPSSPTPPPPPPSPTPAPPPPLPPPSPLRPPPPFRMKKAAALNERFHRSPYQADWSAGFLADAGLLVHVFDSWEAGDILWEPHPARSEIAVSLLFGAQRVAMGRHSIPNFPGNNGGTAGLIFRPGSDTKVTCGKATDSGGTCGPSWCDASRLAEEWNESQDKQCAWRPEDIGAQLKRLTEYQARYHHLDDMYNELIVPSRWWLGHNPDTIEAIFGDRNAHSRFLRTFAAQGVTEATHPFVALDHSNWDSPVQ